jgi:hypothetical protein
MVKGVSGQEGRRTGTGAICETRGTQVRGYLILVAPRRSNVNNWPHGMTPHPARAGW